ncbi:hypothetical protein MVEN_00749200 [Mycena venus]|uniref:Uncharacterized protein n=1 Tax=Mycena venus TaxID=2733690 RepID=A0A8H7D3K4_9AGAR|nr:hypothetical protein MVEN_00749200 [Mycena venus]
MTINAASLSRVSFWESSFHTGAAWMHTGRWRLMARAAPANAKCHGAEALGTPEILLNRKLQYCLNMKPSALRPAHLGERPVMQISNQILIDPLIVLRFLVSYVLALELCGPPSASWPTSLRHGFRSRISWAITLLDSLHGSTCIGSVTLSGSIPTLWFADAHAIKTVVAEPGIFQKDLEATPEGCESCLQ